MVTNPRRVTFDPSADHDVIDGYELQIVDKGGAVVQTLDLGKPPIVDGRVGADVNVQPTKFDTYTFVGVSVAGQVKSDPSDPSEVWKRGPGKPGQPVAS